MRRQGHENYILCFTETGTLRYTLSTQKICSNIYLRIHNDSYIELHDNTKEKRTRRELLVLCWFVVVVVVLLLLFVCLLLQWMLLLISFY